MFKRLKKDILNYKQVALVIIAIVSGGVLSVFRYNLAAHIVIIIACVVVVVPLILDMMQTIRSGQYGIDILAITAIVTSIILREYWAAIIIVLMLTGGESLEEYAETKAKNELKSLFDLRPKKAHLVRGRKTVDISVHSVEVQDKLTIFPGEVVPVDCIILDGASSIDESSLTGESIPVIKIVGDQILSGSVNVEGALIVQAVHKSKDSQYEQILKLVRSASTTQSPFVRLADRYSIPFTVSAFIIAGSVWFISGHALRFLEVLVVATPCPLLLGAPIALISGMSRAAKNGIIFKTGSAIERASEVQTVAFDKTGTLTMGRPTVSTIKTYNNYTKTDVIMYASALESSSNHILASAIHAKSKALHAKNLVAKQVQEKIGHGLSGRLQGKTIQLGRLDMLANEPITMPKKFILPKIKTTAVYIAVAGSLAGIIEFTDEIRPESPTTIERIKALGIKNILMVTGDNLLAAKSVAKKLHIDNVHADCLPVDKILAIESTPHHPVAFVGDGVNDAPVLTAADVGIALGARGSTAASESADVVILHDNIEQIATAFEIAKRTFFIAKQSILIGIIISLLLMGVFATGIFRPVYGAVTQEIVDILVILNALRALGGKKNKIIA
ncbi:MAG: heavy metal translocating P-type ATPase [Candidatus Saccharimonadales bacterium]